MKEEKRPLDISEQSGLTEELSDNDLKNIAGGFATSAIDPSRIYLTTIGRITALQQHPVPPYGVLPYRMSKLTR